REKTSHILLLSERFSLDKREVRAEEMQLFLSRDKDLGMLSQIVIHRRGPALRGPNDQKIRLTHVYPLSRHGNARDMPFLLHAFGMLGSAPKKWIPSRLPISLPQSCCPPRPKKP